MPFEYLLQGIGLVFKKEILFKIFLIQIYKYIMLENLSIEQVSSY